MKKKYKLIIILSSLFVLLFMVVGIVVISNRIKKNDNKTADPKEELNTRDNELKDNVYNNFLIAYLLEADIKTGDGTLTIAGEDGVYYAVTDYLLENIHSLNDINDLIDKTLDDTTIIRAKKFMKSEYSNQFTQSDGVLYVKKSISPCTVNRGEPVDRSKLTINSSNGRTSVYYNSLPYTPYEDQNNKIKSSSLWFNCMPNFNRIGLDENASYNPEVSEDDNTLTE